MLHLSLRPSSEREGNLPLWAGFAGANRGGSPVLALLFFEKLISNLLGAARHASHGSDVPKPPPPGYAKRFEGPIRTCDEAKTKKFEVVVLTHPCVIGDIYDEIIESPSRLAQSKLPLTVAEPE